MAAGEQRIHVPARTGRAVPVAAGQIVEVIDLRGKQVVDFFAFNAETIDEVLSPTHTRTMALSLRLKVGDTLYSNLRNPMLDLIADTVGRHDLLVAPCDARRYELGYGLPDHANCRGNCHRAMAPYGLAYGRVPDPVNLFMNVRIADDGSLGVEAPLSRPGDYVRLRARMSLIVAVSACPQDMNETNGFDPTDIELRIYDGEDPAG